VQRTPSAEAVRPTRRAISPRLAMSTEVIGVLEVVEDVRCLACEERIARANARVLEAGSIGNKMRFLTPQEKEYQLNECSIVSWL
jgi:hypothetical protein